jgi:hypothetical protein
VQDATLRSGIARVVSMKKRGSAFGSFNAVYGVARLAGRVAMGCSTITRRRGSSRSAARCSSPPR